MQELLRERPEWWQLIARACLEYGDIAITGYADSLIPDLRRFEDRGLVAQAYRSLRFVDVAGLADIAAGRESQLLG